MKRFINILFGLLLFYQGYGQVSDRDKINYQAVVVDSTDQLAVNKMVGVKVSILEGSETGTVWYVETHTGMTDEQGLLTLEIGGGTSVTGQYDTIDWSGSSYFIRTEIDLMGGANYSITGTQPIGSVPFALYTKSATEKDPVFSSSAAGGITSADTTYWNNKQNQLIAGSGFTISGDTIKVNPPSDHYIGELFGGGVICWLDDKREHGLILSMVDLSSGSPWSNVTGEMALTNAWDGQNNIAAIINQTGHTSSAAQTCADYTNADYGTGIYDDWYLPSLTEFFLMMPNSFKVKKSILTYSNPGVNPPVTLLNETTRYWTSTESPFDPNILVYSLMLSGNVNALFKNTTVYVRVRAMRKF